MKNGFINLNSNIRILASASAVGKKEGEGPLGSLFDHIIADSFCGKASWEQAESCLQQTAFEAAVKKAGLRPGEAGCIFAGDLLANSAGSVYGAGEAGLPFFGVYGACSTAAETIILASALLTGGLAERCACVTSSHFCTAERQFRTPLEYGGQRAPTAQWTSTAAGAFILSARAEKTQNARLPRVVCATAGRIIDKGVTDTSNMGAAMAPAAFDTISRHLVSRGASPSDYDLIATGDLGFIGGEILLGLFAEHGVSLANYTDCGRLIYDRVGQDVHSGGSGCGCSASVLSAYILPKLISGEYRRVLFCPTGAMMSVTTSQQKQSIPGICYAVEIECGE
ncbi:MAG: stage V sporulation protein AD [Oscillospiraceae bacterium]|jgi:stage V sporulation protein AD|nr:stage V sporulation protein AD [Oscillospiraceae bacterium]